MIKSIFIGVVALLVGYKLYQYAEDMFTSPTGAMDKQVQKNNATTNDGVLSLKFEDAIYNYQLTSSFSLDLLTNGADRHQSWMSAAFVAGIPLAEAKKLLSQYPDMNRCGAEGSQIAQSATQIFDIALAPYNKEAAHNLANFIESRKESQYLMCVRLEGHQTAWLNGSIEGKKYKAMQPSTSAKMVYIDAVTAIDCNTAQPLKL